MIEKQYSIELVVKVKFEKDMVDNDLEKAVLFHLGQHGVCENKLLDNIKEQVDKLVIIEHVHPINYDVLIEVEKDIEGISTLNIEY